ncbi:MAG: hypothetical protein FD166_982 [Bacteroidetes bacterium]|nr:MAG: hypothetical protein FD166_982 [Bacteroidota bacterium]
MIEEQFIEHQCDRMKNKKSSYIIVSISIFVGLLHFVIGPDYQGIFKYFIRGYLIDILLPMNLYLLMQISIRKNIPVNKARIIGALFTFAFGTIVEILQLYKIEFLGRTYDPCDILMYFIGIGLGIVIDLTIIDKFEKQM